VFLLQLEEQVVQKLQIQQEQEKMLEPIQVLVEEQAQNSVSTAGGAGGSGIVVIRYKFQ
jgi:hypothetical protein